MTALLIVAATLVTLALVAVAAARMRLLTVRLGPPAKPRTPKPRRRPRHERIHVS